ncbi:MAG: pur operon repressor [Peptostreptococcaceae bacterium]|nr:pur operon repressor [Peptostreptococcaceae bacterium]MDY5738838.1 pur operon repressor [Anaerovoracaceae bacterium]SFE36622.1 purine operon repressor, PurR [Peptostreptococcaceae bacterium pGA-8]
MKRAVRIGTIVKILTDSPGKLFPLQYFCDLFGVAKSSISEDIILADESTVAAHSGRIITIAGAAGGVKFIPAIDKEECRKVQDDICKRITDESRILGGGFLYTSDIMFDMSLAIKLSRIFATKFSDINADYVATVETKGIPLAAMVAHQLNLPLIVIRREAKFSDGSTVSINYFSGSYDRVQKMSLAKRAVVPGSKAIAIDDFMRGGGSSKGIADILSEFDIELVATGIAIVAREPEKKKIDNFVPIIYLDYVDEENKVIKVSPNDNLFD